MTGEALLLDHLLTHPRFPELVHHIRATTPTAVADQVDAAAADATGTMHGLAAALGTAVGYRDPGDVADWLRLSLLDTWARFLTGEADTCVHSPDPRSPQPVMAAAWKPGLVTCLRCAGFLFKVGAAADGTCDACGHLCEGVQHNDGITPACVQLGPMVYQYGVCEACRSAAMGQAGEPSWC